MHRRNRDDGNGGDDPLQGKGETGREQSQSGREPGRIVEPDRQQAEDDQNSGEQVESLTHPEAELAPSMAVALRDEVEDGDEGVGHGVGDAVAPEGIVRAGFSGIARAEDYLYMVSSVSLAVVRHMAETLCKTVRGGESRWTVRGFSNSPSGSASIFSVRLVIGTQQRSVSL